MSDERRTFALNDLKSFADDLEKLQALEPWRFFRPLPKQALVRRFIGQRFQVVLFQGGNWTGKTITGADVCVEVGATGGIQDYDVEIYVDDDGNYQRKYYKREFLRMCDTPNMGRIIADKEMVEKDVIYNLRKFLHPDFFSTEKKGRPFDSQWWFANGSSFDIMTTDQAPKQFEGVNLQWTWANEPPPEAIFKAALGRFKSGGTMFITATILGCAWILDEIIESDNPRYKVVTMDIDENRKSLGGYLPDQAVDDMLSSQDPNEREARKSGKALILAGRVFKNYRHDGVDAHFCEFANPPLENIDILMATDPHDKLPNYSLWAFVKNGMVYFYREHPTDDFWEFSDNPWADPDELAEIYKRMEEIDGQEPTIRLLDKKFGSTAKFGQKLTVQEVLEASELNYELWDGNSRAAVNALIGRYLEQGRVKISTACKNLDKALMRHRFLEHASSRAKDEKGQRQDVDEKTRHPIDTMGAILNEVEKGIGKAPVIYFSKDRVKSDEEQLNDRIWGDTMVFDPSDYDNEQPDDFDIVVIDL